MPTRPAGTGLNESNASPTGQRADRKLLLALIALLLLGLIVWRGWASWHARDVRMQAQAQASEQRIAALEQRLEALRRDQRAQTQRIQDAAATNRVLRDEVLGLSQRGALLEDSVSRLADSTRHAPQALRLDEVELLLSQGLQRLQIAADLDGTRRAYALAAGALQGVDDPRLLNLRQALAQERAALDGLGDGPRAQAAIRLDRFATALQKLPREAIDNATRRPAWQRALAPLIDVRPTAEAMALAPGERAAAETALQIDLNLARAAIERNDAAGFHAALDRVQAWLPRLWPQSPPLRQVRSELEALRAATLQPRLPELGSTLEQLRVLRNAGPVPVLTAPAPGDVTGAGQEESR